MQPTGVVAGFTEQNQAFADLKYRQQQIAMQQAQIDANKRQLAALAAMVNGMGDQSGLTAGGSPMAGGPQTAMPPQGSAPAPAPTGGPPQAPQGPQGPQMSPAAMAPGPINIQPPSLQQKPFSTPIAPMGPAGGAGPQTVAPPQATPPQGGPQQGGPAQGGADASPQSDASDYYKQTQAIFRSIVMDIKRRNPGIDPLTLATAAEQQLEVLKGLDPGMKASMQMQVNMLKAQLQFETNMRKAQTAEEREKVYADYVASLNNYHGRMAGAAETRAAAQANKQGGSEYEKAMQRVGNARKAVEADLAKARTAYMNALKGMPPPSPANLARITETYNAARRDAKKRSDDLDVQEREIRKQYGQDQTKAAAKAGAEGKNQRVIKQIAHTPDREDWVGLGAKPLPDDPDTLVLPQKGKDGKVTYKVVWTKADEDKADSDSGDQ